MPVGKLFKRAEYFVPRTSTKADALKGERVETGAMTAPSVRCRLSNSLPRHVLAPHWGAGNAISPATSSGLLGS
jgi:hypothetical protein